jgi:hypothetical protein
MRRRYGGGAVALSREEAPTDLARPYSDLNEAASLSDIVGRMLRRRSDPVKRTGRNRDFYSLKAVYADWPGLKTSAGAQRGRSSTFV